MKFSRLFFKCAAVIIMAFAMLAGSGLVMAARPIGIDVSEYQSASLNWATLKNTYGISFGWTKAMEGQCGSCGGDNWAPHVLSAKAAGVLIGPYHFARNDLDPGTNGAAAEATAFWNKVKGDMKADGLSLMPMLDVESPFILTNKTEVSLWVDTWCTTVSNLAYAAGFRVKPCIYISASKAATYLNSTVTKWNTDIANWYSDHSTAESQAQAASGPPYGISPWTTWQFWQYDDQNVAQAYTTGDGDIFNGTYTQLTNTMLVTPVGPVFTSPTNRTVLPGSNTTFAVTATGTGTLHYQWMFDQTNIAGATSSSYIINNVQLTNAGLYTVRVADNLGTNFSDDASLSVKIPLVNAPGSIVAPTGMVNWWTADGTVNDLYGTVNGIAQNGFYYSPGESGLAFHFDGSTSIITNTAANLAVPWTLCLWVNRSNSPQTSALIVGDGNYGLKLEQYNATRQLGLTILNVGDYKFSPTYTVPQGIWTHLAFVGTSTGVTAYANGVLKGSLTNVITLPRKYWGAAYITSSAKYVDYMFGSMDEIMTFNRALSVSEISAISAAGTAGLVRGPEILGSQYTGANQFTINLKGRTGKNYTLYSSTDLITWASMGTLANTVGTNQFIDNSATNDQKFYRASQTY